jgi:hypothetical protein
MSRYRIEGDWTELRRTEVEGFGADRVAGVLIYETATLVDSRGGHRYDQGAHRIRVESKLAGKPRTKTFQGETAWSQAESYERDCETVLRRASAA